MNSKLKHMLDTIRSEAKYTAPYTGRESFSERTMQAMQQVDRENFVDGYYKTSAFDNGPLPIGYGQTISQPYIVALMTDLLDLTSESIVLEIGTGSGYQAAILSQLAHEVYSIERIPELAEAANQRLEKLGYSNVHTRCANGYYGWAAKGPFDAIIVTAAASHIPQDLIDQLKPGGKLVIPVGLPYMHQELMVVDKDMDGKTETRSVLAVVFVPLIDDEREKVLED